MIEQRVVPVHKLGKKPPKIPFSAQPIKFRDYLRAARWVEGHWIQKVLRVTPAAAVLPTPLPSDWLAKVPASGWPMLGNDTLGDCVEACTGHMMQLWGSYQNSPPPVMTDAQVIQLYSAVGGYVPGDPSTDNGTVIEDLLAYWKNTGINGTKIAAYAALQPGNLYEMRMAVQIFGCASIGWALPITAQGQSTWSFVSKHGDGAPGSWGGHNTPIGMDALDGSPSETISWGGVLGVTNKFYKVYNDEAWVVVSPEWLENNESPSGFDLAQLLADSAAL